MIPDSLRRIRRVRKRRLSARPLPRPSDGTGSPAQGFAVGCAAAVFFSTVHGAFSLSKNKENGGCIPAPQPAQTPDSPETVRLIFIARPTAGRCLRAEGWKLQVPGSPRSGRPSPPGSGPPFSLVLPRENAPPAVEERGAGTHPAKADFTEIRFAGTLCPRNGRGKGRADNRRFRSRRIQRRKIGDQIESVSASWAAAAPPALTSAASAARSEAERAGLLRKDIRICTTSAPKRVQPRMPAPI